jgi:hypothetical protein
MQLPYSKCLRAGHCDFGHGGDGDRHVERNEDNKVAVLALFSGVGSAQVDDELGERIHDGGLAGQTGRCGLSVVLWVVKDGEVELS